LSRQIFSQDFNGSEILFRKIFSRKNGKFPGENFLKNSKTIFKKRILNGKFKKVKKIPEKLLQGERPLDFFL